MPWLKHVFCFVLASRSHDSAIFRISLCLPSVAVRLLCLGSSLPLLSVAVGLSPDTTGGTNPRLLQQGGCVGFPLVVPVAHPHANCCTVMVEISVNVTSVLSSPELRVGACLLPRPHTKKMQVNDKALLGRKGLFRFCGFLLGQSWS